ncbi:hypothetical protein Q0590_15815 [Rhodocytophaga aerolata]|uniref:DUF4907 domain-containing protein n=1 Tax=Rhodocytophaga aerolata TaxID=455078 RepID=A0ABT8R6L6_9BACT|nr:hypothetical protein [Rhodocytophaga aerolata]MDO1447738.1 hypothetical protein [Rhodocytophaga aerolata]
MKTLINPCFIKATSLFFLLILHIQAVAESPAFSPDGGYWVVETNVQTKDFTIIKFYDARHHLLYEEKIEGRFVDIHKPKHRKMLDKSLKMLEHNNLIASQLKGYQQQITSALARKRE